LFELIRILLLFCTILYFATAGLALGYSILRLLADEGERVAITSSFNWKLSFFQLLLIPIILIITIVYPEIANWFLTKYYWLLVPLIIGVIIRLAIAIINARKNYRKPTYNLFDMVYDIAGLIVCVIIGLLVASIVHPQVGHAKADFIAKHLKPMLNFGHISAAAFVPAWLAYYASANILYRLKNKYIAIEFKEKVIVAAVVAYSVFAFSFVLGYALDNFFVRQIAGHSVSFLCFLLATLSLAVSAVAIQAEKYLFASSLASFQICLVAAGMCLALLPGIVKRVDKVFNFFVTCSTEETLKSLALGISACLLLVSLMAYFLKYLKNNKKRQYIFK